MPTDKAGREFAVGQLVLRGESFGHRPELTVRQVHGFGKKGLPVLSRRGTVARFPSRMLILDGLLSEEGKRVFEAMLKDEDRVPADA